MTRNYTYCKEWGPVEDARPVPSEDFMTAYMVALASAGFFMVIVIRCISKKDMRKLLEDGGVCVKKVAKTASEIERKAFHLCGLLVPLIYQVLLSRGWNQSECRKIVWAITIPGMSTDWMRVNVPFVKRNWPLKGILREREEHQLCGGSYFSLGCTLAIQFFPPVIAMTSIVFLVMGDMSAALVGRSFGGTWCSTKIGPDGKKSVEGSTAMFLVCMVFGCSIFSQVHLREYAVCIAALVATLAELYEPFGLNDNVTIPVLSGVALTFGFARTYSCEPGRNPLLWHDLWTGDPW